MRNLIVIPHLSCDLMYMSYITRYLSIESALKKKSVLLLGPRRTGKSALLKNQLHSDQTYDLLKADVFQALATRPSRIREALRPGIERIVIDEIQKLPSLMDEVHAMIEEFGIRFVLTGSSARKLKRSHTSLMAGRARRMTLHPFCYTEIKKDFELLKSLQFGTLPPIYLLTDANEAWRELQDYTGDYIREEILAEALVRKIEAFSRFLPVAARTNGELLNYEAIASDSQVPARTIREYYSLLEDTLIGRTLEPLRFKGSKSRKAIATSKFYFFDTGVLNSLIGRKSLSDSTTEFGNVFETWIYNELKRYIDYSENDSQIQFWRSPIGQEVDLVINGEVAIEIKATSVITDRHLVGLEALGNLKKLKKKLIVCREGQPRKIKDVQIIPWPQFMEALWGGDII